VEFHVSSPEYGKSHNEITANKSIDNKTDLNIWELEKR
jgi:hypothetical protein